MAPAVEKEKPTIPPPAPIDVTEFSALLWRVRNLEDRLAQLEPARSPKRMALRALGKPHKPPIAQIIALVADRFGVSAVEIRGSTRHREVVLPRHVAMYLAMSFTGNGFAMVGREFDRDHTVVLYARNKIAKLRKAIASLDQEITKIEIMLRSGDVPMRPESCLDGGLNG
jgi:chromosomal replication initiation ATPase DnaA